jgi:hypothetical protein
MNSNERIQKMIAQHSDIWKTHSAFMSYLRGGVRLALWKRHPVKIEFKKSKRFKIESSVKAKEGQPPKMVWGGECEICKGHFREAFLDVDHKSEKGCSLKDMDDIQNFVEHITIVTFDDLRLLCKDCHTVVNHQQKTGYSFEKAKKDKEFIEIEKTKEFASHLKKLGVTEIPKFKKDQATLLRNLMLESYNG